MSDVVAFESEEGTLKCVECASYEDEVNAANVFTLEDLEIVFPRQVVYCDYCYNPINEDVDSDE